MAKKKTEKTAEKAVKKEVQAKEEPKVDDKVEKIKIKKPSIKKIVEEDIVYKVDLSKPVEDTKEEVKEEVKEEIKEEVKEEKPVIEEVAEKVEEAVVESKKTGEPLPESVQKLVDFMNETGGDLNDYVKLNRDYSELDNLSLLEEYYTQTKPHLNKEEINFLMEDQFSYDKESDDDKEIQRKKLALKEQVASAKTHLEENKSKYYEDIKSGSKLTSEQQKAIDFFNRYNKESEENEKAAEHRKSTFLQKTDKVFNNEFKGFEYSIGDKNYRFNVNDVDKVKNNQSDLNNFVGKFLDENSTMKDAEGYHKSLFTAMNADAIAKHFYEQGKSDAIKHSVETGKNVNMEPRQAHGEVEAGGLKFKVLGDDSNTLKFKIKNK